MYQALLALVRVHAQVSGVAKPLLERTMNSLVEDLTSEAFTCFQKVGKFGMGGMLRVGPCMHVSLAKTLPIDREHRLPSKLNLSTRRLSNTFPLLHLKRSQPYITLSRRHILVVLALQAVRACRKSLRASSEHCTIVEGPQPFSSCASNQQRIPLHRPSYLRRPRYDPRRLLRRRGNTQRFVRVCVCK